MAGPLVSVAYPPRLQLADDGPVPEPAPAREPADGLRPVAAPPGRLAPSSQPQRSG
jgi:hypothetical protein